MLIWFNLQTDGTRNELSNIKETFAPTYEYFPVFNPSLSSSYDCCAKFKEKVPDVSDPNQNVETRSLSKLKFS